MLPLARPCSVCHEPTRNYGVGMVLRDAETDEPHWCPQRAVPYWQTCALCEELKQSDIPHVCMPEPLEFSGGNSGGMAEMPPTDTPVRPTGFGSLI